MQATTVDEVIETLEKIIQESKNNESPLGYFAALYKKVTIKVKEGIEEGFFEDGPRMEKLDVIFANRYLKAYFDYQKKEEVSLSWQLAFDQTHNYWPTVLQHLLLGMNAHINLDLGIAAAEVTKGTGIESLHKDFNKINKILADLVGEVEEELSEIWPTLKKILMYTQKVDDFLVNFSMTLARDGAWAFAKKLHDAVPEHHASIIQEKDQKVSRNDRLIVSHNIFVRIIFGVIRLGERGSVSDKIAVLNTP